MVHRVSSAKAADLRRFLSRHTKTNGIDADTLARLPLFDPAGLQPLELPGAERAALDRRVRATDRLTRAGRRAQAPDQGPGPPAAADDPADRRSGRRRPGRAGALRRPERPAQAGIQAAHRADREGLPRPPGRRPGPAVARRRRGRRSSSTPATRRSRSPTWPPRSPPRSGCCAPSRPSSPATPPNARTPTAGSTPPAWPAACPASPRSAGPRWSPPWATRPGSPTASSSGPSPVWSPRPPRPATPTARASRCPRPAPRCCAPPWSAPPTTPASQDPQLARIYYVQMVERGKDHLGALCVVAANLAERSWAVMNRGMPYVICDTDGRPVDPRRGQSRSSPSTGPCPPRSAPAGAARRRGRPPRTVLTGQSKPHARGAGKRGDLPQPASSAAPRRRPTSTDEPLDNPSSIGNQFRQPDSACRATGVEGEGTRRRRPRRTDGRAVRRVPRPPQFLGALPAASHDRDAARRWALRSRLTPPRRRRRSPC